MSLSLHHHRAISALLALGLLAGCSTAPSNYVGGGAAGTDAGAGTDATAGADSGAASGDNTKNSAAVAAKDDTGKTTQVDNNKPATKADAEGKVLGAASAGDMLTLFITDASGTVLVVYIDSKKHPLPAKAIPVGEPATDVYVTYTSAGAVYNSKATGTIDIDVCPEADGVAVVGKFNGVVVHNVAPIGAKTVTLTGAFNLVYYGGAGKLTCKKKEETGGKVELGKFTKPAAATCEVNPCDGGTNTSRNCCPYVPCISTCWTKCVNNVQGCVMGCGIDMTCPQKCVAEVYACQSKCLVTCEVSATCATAMEKLNKCEEANSEACQGDDEAKADACVFDKCCAETKAAF